MKIHELTDQWLPQAEKLVLENYREEQRLLPILPDDFPPPNLNIFAQNGLGAVATEGEKLLGFLGAAGPWTPAFFTPSATGVYSPLHAHGAVAENRVEIYRRLYQAAAERWVKAGASSHAITLYAHDKKAEKAFYVYGFGLRCIDLVRQTEGLSFQPPTGFDFLELPYDRHQELTPLRQALSCHLAASPSFMKQSEQMMERWLSEKLNRPPRVFAAEKDGQIVAYLEIDDEGENFATLSPQMQNICGAYCLPEYRGTGLAKALLGFLTQQLQQENYPLLGVDCESFNPTALGFWSKYFSAYTHSVVRRIDENVLL